MVSRPSLRQEVLCRTGTGSCVAVGWFLAGQHETRGCGHVQDPVGLVGWMKGMLWIQPCGGVFSRVCVPAPYHEQKIFKMGF